MFTCPRQRGNFSPNGIVYAQPVSSVTEEVLKVIVHENVNTETTVYTDTLVSYRGLEHWFNHRDLEPEEFVHHLLQVLLT